MKLTGKKVIQVLWIAAFAVSCGESEAPNKIDTGKMLEASPVPARTAMPVKLYSFTCTLGRPVNDKGKRLTQSIPEHNLLQEQKGDTLIVRFEKVSGYVYPWKGSAKRKGDKLLLYYSLADTVEAARHLAHYTYTYKIQNQEKQKPELKIIQQESQPVFK